MEPLTTTVLISLASSGITGLIGYLNGKAAGEEARAKLAEQLREKDRQIKLLATKLLEREGRIKELESKLIDFQTQVSFYRKFISYVFGVDPALSNAYKNLWLEEKLRSSELSGLTEELEGVRHCLQDYIQKIG